MLTSAGLVLWAMLIALVVAIRRVPYGNASPTAEKEAPTTNVSDTAADTALAKETRERSEEQRMAQRSVWAPIEALTAEEASDDEEEEEVAEEEENEEGGEEKEGAEEGEEEEDWADEESDSDSDAPPPKEREQCKMQFIILNSGPKNTKMQPGALCDIISGLSVQNIIKIRQMEAATDLEAIRADPVRREWLRAYHVWDCRGVAKITLRCDTREAFDCIVAKASTELNMPVSVKVMGPTTAVACIGPCTNDAFKDVTGTLKLLS